VSGIAGGGAALNVMVMGGGVRGTGVERMRLGLVAAGGLGGFVEEEGVV
jgi:hypothetical protein